MATRDPTAAGLSFHPLTSHRWEDLTRLFGPRGACAGCWCMWWRQTNAEHERRKGRRNREAFRRVVEAGKTPGLLAFSGHEPIGWCALAPRDAYPRLARSRILKPVDDEPVWSIVCFFVARAHRNGGVTVRMLRAAEEFARRRGAEIVEGYPIEPRKGRVPDTFAYHGLASAFRKAGFEEVARRSPTRPIMRKWLA